MFSKYFTIRAAPRPITPPRLSVTPPAGHVLPGKVLDFHCQAPPPSPGNPPPIFLLMRRPWGADSDQEVGRSFDPHLRVGPVSQADRGTYTCIYQLTLPEGVQNSAPSLPVSIEITAHLPDPLLSNDHEDVLLCTGSPSYPGARFSLYHQGAELPIATQQALTVEHSARFAVKTEGWYQCQYSVLLGTDWAHSERSSTIKLPCTTGSPSCSPSNYTPPPTAHLPDPLLSNDHEDVLLCTGSPSYPGARFSLYHQGAELPIATQQALTVEHSARFAVKTEGWYQCQYSVLLGTDWAHSERSSTIKLPCTTGSPSCSPSNYTPPPTAGSKVDLALIIGSVSAALLFLLVLIILGFAVHKHAKAAAVKRRQREQDTFWQQFYFKDHIVDLTLQRINTSPAEFSGAENGRISVSEPIYDCPFSTFNGPLDK
ncbi:uncharacterized protein LOC118807540 [Colossoma macropomum]|uniref:uncharacterized protein LOC118807540 n=1 Tax=Colossoma macropomum TaxID=42526 RepID=UPI001863A0FE|nr:uncharacterized protein LOC118807540 [Colossoma macropomum]